MTQRTEPLPYPDEMSDAALADYLERRFTPEAVPPCRICGAALSPERVGGGEPTEWACSPYAASEDGKLVFKEGRRFCDDHYDKSFFTQYHTGDAYGLELVQRFRKRAPT
jgi:hypothetical protein